MIPPGFRPLQVQFGHPSLAHVLNCCQLWKIFSIFLQYHVEVAAKFLWFYLIRVEEGGEEVNRLLEDAQGDRYDNMIALISPGQELQIDVCPKYAKRDSNYDMVSLISPAQELQVDVYLEDTLWDRHYNMVALISPAQGKQVDV